MRVRASRQHMAYTQAAFAYFSAGDVGSVDTSFDCARFIAALGQLRAPVSDREARTLFAEADTDGDGRLTWHEFHEVAVCCAATPPQPRVQELTALLEGDPREREKAYIALDKVVAGAAGASGSGSGWACACASAATATFLAGCVAPLMTTVLRADADIVQLEEYQRASLLLARMVSVEPVLIGAHWARGQVTTAIAYAPRSSFGAVMAKPPKELTRKDVVLFGAKHAVDAVAWSVGWMAGGSHLRVWSEGASDIDLLFSTASPSFFDNNWLLKPGKHSSEERNERLLLMMLEILQEESVHDDLDELAIAGFHYCFECGGAGRPAIAMQLVERGFIEMAAAALTLGRPMDWVNRLVGEHRFL